MGQQTRRLRRWFARRGVERFFAAISRSLAKDNPASEHYYWRIAAQQQTRFHHTRDRLVSLLGVDAADHLLRVLSRRVRSSRRAVVLAAGLLWFAPGPLSTMRTPVIVLVTPLALLTGSVLLRRNIRRAAALLGGIGEHPLDNFPYSDVRRAIRRHRNRIPAAALVFHSQQTMLAGYLGEGDPETLEIAGKLAEEFSGTAVELLETSRNLR